MKWIEVNVGINPDIKNIALVELVSPIVRKYKSNFTSWHFLWEAKPWPALKKKGITLRLRFFGENDSITKMKDVLEAKLRRLEHDNSHSFFGHCYGRHGDCPGEYEGEDWGKKGWKLGMKFLQLGSEVALELIENENMLGKSDDYKLSLFRYAERYVHCFLDTIYSTEEEVNFYLQNAIQRLCHLVTKQQFDKEHEKEHQELFKDIKSRIITKSVETLGGAN